MTGSPYEAPQRYLEVLGEPDVEELGCWRALLRGPRVLSIGCGCARVEAPLSAATSWTMHGFDASAAMIDLARRRDAGGDYRVARYDDPPACAPHFDSAMSGLLSLAYATDHAELESVVQWIGRQLAPRAPFVFEVPVSHHPRRLQGVREGWSEGARTFAFEYLDLDSEDELGAVLHTRMTFGDAIGESARNARLRVFTPTGLRVLLTRTGLFESPTFVPPYSPAERTMEPPTDCLRALVVTARLPY